MERLRYVMVAILLLTINNRIIAQNDKYFEGITKLNNTNPVIWPLENTKFFCPIQKQEILWEQKDVFNPAAIVKDNKIYLLYRAEDTVGVHAGTSRLGLAWSYDGINFERKEEPVFYPDNDEFKRFEWEGGCEDPRIVKSNNGVYIMCYTAFDGNVARLCIATSKDLMSWQKHGPAFGKAESGEFGDLWSKAGAIVTKEIDGELVATKINGKYWMYWGESDIYLATSENLIDWEPVTNTQIVEKRLRHISKGKYDVSIPKSQTVLTTALTPRLHNFDSKLVEPGPPAIITDEGILLIYNGANNAKTGDPKYPENAYSGGYALFDKNDPTCLIKRCKEPFFYAEKSSEQKGQMSNVTFLEGLVKFKDKWFLYYGMADSNIGVASFDEL
ncbi:glycoside hydrolase family 130 protein [Galbibacter mesophilus]|uniref:glycoside hydrolase family 130 protein n=1 Tax=Galbibacter mesophilus TaxID=379069 RepID=UPI001F5DB6ED|nr:glycoside hydrolase family 130 protein [Galbibacter mesophilus]MCM5662964.1 glycoside hydrolase family 130 protein [Galbibacter mesophilus]